jgi:hypothetical protein
LCEIASFRAFAAAERVIGMNYRRGGVVIERSQMHFSSDKHAQNIKFMAMNSSTFW